MKMIDKEFLDLFVYKSKKKKIIFNASADAGFYSEFNNLVFALLYCIENEIYFELQTHGNSIFYEKGWTDYFIPFCKMRKNSLLLKYNVRPYMATGRSYPLMTKLLKFLYSVDYFTQDIFYQFRNDFNSRKYFFSKRNNINYKFISACNNIVNLIYNFNEKTNKEIGVLLKELKIPDKYVAIHIRRGDKVKENAVYDLDKYFNKIPSGFKNIFVHSDDSDVIKKLREKYVDYKFFFADEKNDEKGYNHNDFKKSPSKVRKDKTIFMFFILKYLKNQICLLVVLMQTLACLFGWLGLEMGV